MDTMAMAFLRGLADELEKDAADMVCDTPGMKKRSKGKGKGLARGKGKGPMGIPTKRVGRRDMGKEAGHASNYLYEKVTGKKKKKLFGKGGLIHDTDKKKGSSIKAKIEAARKDPSTKANPKDTGPPGSGTQDPRFKAMKKKAAEDVFFAGFDYAMDKEAGPAARTAKLREALKGLKATGVPAKAMPPGPAARSVTKEEAKPGLLSKIRANLGLRKAKKGLKAAGIPVKAIPGR